MAGTYVFVGPNSNMAALTSITDGGTPPTGQIGELLAAQQGGRTTTGIGATGVFGSVIQVNVTPGRWLLYGAAAFSLNGATLTGGLQCGISSSPSGAGINEFDTTIFSPIPTADNILHPPHIVVYLSATTTYYLNTKFTYSAGTPSHGGKIYALRIG